jgi:hypothetical protein
MANVTVIGAQWGDEGKGKIVDWLASRADVVVRFQGGHNAGHTLVVGDQTYKLSCCLGHRARHAVGDRQRRGARSLGAARSRQAEGQGVSITPTIRIADNCPLILPLHRDLDGCAKRGRARARSAPPGAASARPMKTRSAAARSACAIWRISMRWSRSSTASAPTTMRCAPASASRRSTAPRCSRSCAKSRPSCCNSPSRCGSG